jgi:predicted TIM-barrel fold metal-dependent hydrolase
VIKMKIDAFAHILPSRFYQQMLAVAPQIPEQYPFIKIKTLTDIEARLQLWPDKSVKQVLSLVNINPENYVDPEQAAAICRDANEELSTIVNDHPDVFAAGVAILPMNNIAEAVKTIEQVAQSPVLVGAQIYTRHLGKSIADPAFAPVLAKAAALGVPLWLHPVFDQRKPDNELVFSWEYELSQAMLQLVQRDLFKKYPQIKIIVHHAGAMVPFFAGRIEHILPSSQAADFKKFYVDTAIIGNPAALRLALAYYGVDHVLFGTDAPFAVQPCGANQIIVDAINSLDLSAADLAKIYHDNFEKLVKSI